MINSIKNNLQECILPFWMDLKDDEFGGFYGYKGLDLMTDKKADKGVILNSRILWFFSNAYLTLGDNVYLEYAKHAYDFLVNACIDRVNGGVYWSLTYDKKPADTTKHTYNQAFAIYALSSYYDASKNRAALDKAYELFNIIEDKCRDLDGYLEAFDLCFNPASNEKLSENGVEATRTMNTLLHVFEAYTELYRVDENKQVRTKLEAILNIIYTKIYNKKEKRQEVFFDSEYNSLIDLHSYGHDIETAWLIDRGLEVLGDYENADEIYDMTKALTENIFNKALSDKGLWNECENGMVDKRRVWWVQNEAVIGFINGYQHDKTKTKYLDAAKKVWTFCEESMIDKREGSEWFNELDEDGEVIEKEIAGPWKCPYHNGRMCFEVIRRNIDA